MTDLSADELAAIRENLSLEERAELDELLGDTVVPEPLLAFLPRVSPTLAAPLHLGEIAHLMERTRTEQVRAVVGAPPQHGKTTLITHGLVWVMSGDGRRHAYCSYNGERGRDVSYEMQEIASRAGLGWRGSRRLWETDGGGSLYATGVGGGITGRPIDGVMILDDLFKNREEAESASHREKVDGWFKTSIIPRLHPGASVIEVQTRWHPDDQAGRLLARGYEPVNLPAILDRGLETERALWPESRPLSFLKQQLEDMGELDFEALYMGNPQAAGAKLFPGEATYRKEEAPPLTRVAIGVDLAYTEESRADWSVAVVVAEARGVWYVLDVIQRQCEAPDFAEELIRLRQRYPGAPMLWRAAGTEKGSAQFIKRAGAGLTVRAASKSKYIRALPASYAWKRGKIRVPAEPRPWKEVFLRVVQGFTGLGDANDDEVDGLGSALEMLPASKGDDTPRFGTPSWYAWEQQRAQQAAIDSVNGRRR